MKNGLQGCRMNGDRKRRLWIAAGLQVLAAVAIAGAVFYLLYSYVQYGEQGAPVAGTSSLSETAGTEFTGAELAGDADVELPGTEPAGTEGAAGVGADGDAKLPGSIRVQILDSELTGTFHSEVSVSCEKAFSVKLDEKRIRKGKNYAVRASELREGQLVELSPKDGASLTVESLKRADGPPRYAGTLWLYREAEGIVLVNELPLEEYLCGVVSSEMPSDYPMEALKAQAVCARTYACNCIRNARDETDTQEESSEESKGSASESSQAYASEAARRKAKPDLDDSVSYQVYNNYQATEQSRQAVEATQGEILPLDEIQYYSTSCQSEHREDLDNDEAFRTFLAQEPDAGAEYDSPWLRWETEIRAEDLLQRLAAGYGWEADRLDEIRVAKREGNGQVTELELRCGDSVKTVSGEYAIRQLFTLAQSVLRLRDGEEHSGMQTLPSAFFWLEAVKMQKPDGEKQTTGQQEPDRTQEPESETPANAEEQDLLLTDLVVIHGGGYGHGIGMSQYGAAALAKKGLDYRGILEYYYGVDVTGR